VVVVNRRVQDGSVWGHGDPSAAPGGGVGSESAYANPYLALETAFPCTEAPVRVRTGSVSHEEGKGMPETNADPREGQQIKNFELPDHELLPFDLYQTLKEAPLVLVFYRGDW
jgi:hypothetical protein